MSKRALASVDELDQAHTHKRHRGPVRCSCRKRLVDGLASVRRGVAYVWLHFIYGPLRFQPRATEAHKLLTRSASSLKRLDRAVSDAEHRPFHAPMPVDTPTFFKEPDNSVARSSSIGEAKHRALRIALEVQRKTIVESAQRSPLFRCRPDPNVKHWFARVPLEVTRSDPDLEIDGDSESNKTTLFDSAADGLLAATPDELLAGLHIRFHSNGSAESGVDSGGLTREFLDKTIRELVRPPESPSTKFSSSSSSDSIRRIRSVRGLGDPMFKEQADGALMLLPSSRPPAAHFALGRLIAAALVHASYGEAVLPLPLNDCLLKFIVGQPLSAVDVRRRDPLYFKNRIEALLQPGGIETMAAVLCVDRLVFEEDDVELIPGGAQVVVTEDNVQKYVSCLVDHFVCGRVRKELSEFLAGFHDVIPQEVLQRCSISFSELGMLLSGAPELHVKDWEEHAKIEAAGVSEEVAARIANWLFRTLEAWSQEDLSPLLAFVTGCSRLPAVGFARLDPPFTVEVIPYSGQLPTTHTCFNRLALPAYEDQETLADRLSFATHEGAGSFFLV